MSNAPTTLLGMVPLVRAVVRSATDATATTVTPDDSGTLFVDLSTSAHTYTLPAVADGAGKTFIFFDGETTQTTVITVSGSSDTLMGDDDAAADTITFPATVGAFAIVIGDGTNYYCLLGPGSYTAA